MSAGKAPMGFQKAAFNAIFVLMNVLFPKECLENAVFDQMKIKN